MYKKITINFKKIRKIKSLLKDVYKAKSNHLDGILKFKLPESLIPKTIERAEIVIKSILNEEVIVIPRNGLTFLTGDKLPFKTIENNSVVEDKYIILPWNLDTESSRLELKNLIKKIPKTIKGMICTISYSLYVNENKQAEPEVAATTTVTAPATSQITVTEPQVITETMQDFSWSGTSFSEDNEEKLLDEIDLLRKEVEELRSKKTAEENWTLELLPMGVKEVQTPSCISRKGGDINIPGLGAGISMRALNVFKDASFINVTGNIFLDINNHKLIINSDSGCDKLIIH